MNRRAFKESCIEQDDLHSAARRAEYLGIVNTAEVAPVRVRGLTEEIEKFEPDKETLLAREQWRQQLLKRMFYLLREQASDVTEGSTEESYTAFLDEIA